MNSIDAQPMPDEPGARVPTEPVWVAGQEFRLFEESPPLIDAMVVDIHAARTRVWMESYIFADDAAGRAVADALAQRAAAGLDVRLMVDAWGSFSTPSALFDRLRSAGVQVHMFHAIGAALGIKFLSVLNQRNHRKLLVIDQNIAYFGGMNIVDQRGIHSPADTKRRHLPRSAGWRDVHVRMTGTRVAVVAEVCDRLWRRVHLERPRHRAPRWPVKQALRAPADAIFFFDSRPWFKYRRPQRVLIPLIRQAREEVTLSIAYFVPVGRLLGELVRARKRGARVRVIVPGHTDVRIVQWAARHFYEYMLKRGIEIYERKDLILHSKVMVVDGRWSVIGSCNLDARSLRFNLEFFALIHAPQMAQAIDRICAEELENSVRIDEDYLRARSWWQRLRDRIFWKFRRWL